MRLLSRAVRLQISKMGNEVVCLHEEAEELENEAEEKRREAEAIESKIEDLQHDG